MGRKRRRIGVAAPRRRPTGSLVTLFLDPVLKGERDAKRER